MRLLRSRPTLGLLLGGIVAASSAALVLELSVNKWRESQKFRLSHDEPVSALFDAFISWIEIMKISVNIY